SLLSHYLPHLVNQIDSSATISATRGVALVSCSQHADPRPKPLFPDLDVHVNLPGHQSRGHYMLSAIGTVLLEAADLCVRRICLITAVDRGWKPSAQLSRTSCTPLSISLPSRVCSAKVNLACLLQLQV